LPGMTANLTFEVERHKDVLRIPNAALRFVPSDEDKAKMMVAPPETDSAVISDTDQASLSGGLSLSDTAQAGNRRGDAQSGGMSQTNSTGTGMSGRHDHSRNSSKKEAALKQVYVLVGENKFQAVSVRLGITDGSFTEVLGGELAEGEAVITGTIKKGEAAMVNPFMPQFGGGARGARPPR
jgi:HlyD family secretion protein